MSLFVCIDTTNYKVHNRPQRLIKVSKTDALLLGLLCPHGVTDFLRNYCAVLNKILYESFQVNGNEKIMTLCRSHDQDGRHKICIVVSEKIRFEFLHVHGLGPRSRNHLDL